MLTIGVDIGSVGTKAVLFDGDIVDRHLEPTGWNPSEAGHRAMESLLKRNSLSPGRIDRVVSTGYGRKSFAEVDKAVTEITCHARGAHFMDPEIRTVLDIGGQDSKVILLDDQGRVLDFMMNDKCAAGTGRFLQVMATLLEYSIEEFGAVDPDGEMQKISSMCTVFAESEVVSHLAKGISKDAVALGLLESVAVRASSMLGRLGIKPVVGFTGGVSRCPSLVSLLEGQLNCDVRTYGDSHYAGALGSALIASEL
ncbi:MAG: acyl-CoA dehydratase activase [Synergistota bacterium]|nr:acyl-CoA dehydratase activase [Synergistota bacterium]